MIGYYIILPCIIIHTGCVRERMGEGERACERERAFEREREKESDWEKKGGEIVSLIGR